MRVTEQKSEAQVEKEIADALTICGFKVLKTSAVRTKGVFGQSKDEPESTTEEVK